MNIQPELEYIRYTMDIIENEIRIQSLQYITLYNQVYDLIEIRTTDKIYEAENKFNEYILINISFIQNYRI